MNQDDPKTDGQSGPVDDDSEKKAPDGASGGESPSRNRGEESRPQRSGPPRSGPPKGRKPRSLMEDLENLDGRLVEMLAKRSELLGRAASVRRSKQISVSDPGQEKRLWLVWAKEWERSGLDKKGLRKLFSLANAMAYELASGKSGGSKPFTLRPKRSPMDIDLDGPGHLRLTRCWTALAAAAGGACEMTGAVLSDDLVELVKGLNQAGAHLSWEADGLKSATPDRSPSNPDGPLLAFEDKTVFAGADPLNLYLLLALALPSSGRCRFAGSLALKSLDLDPASRLLPNLGARLVGLEPGSPGLPVRLETPGDVGGRIPADEILDPDLVLALAVCGWSYPHGLTLVADPESRHRPNLALAASLLEIFGVTAVLDETGFSVKRSFPQVPATYAPPMDPILSALLLVLPQLTGGRTRLTGSWPKNDPEAEAALAMLRTCGLEMEIGSRQVQSRAETPARPIPYEGPTTKRLFPLALTLAMLGDKECELPLPLDPESSVHAEEYLDQVQASYIMRRGSVCLKEDPPKRFESWTAPTPWFGLASSLLAFRLPGITLTNPGEAASVWPAFWNLYNSLPAPSHGEQAPTETDDEPKSSRRRIRIK